MPTVSPPPAAAPAPAVGAPRRVRLFGYCSWAAGLQDAREFLAHPDRIDVGARLSDPRDTRLRRMARLDCDWHVETVRALVGLADPRITFLPARVLGAPGLSELVARRRPPDEAWWFILTGQQPQALARVIGPTLRFLAQQDVRTLYYAFDEASRTMPVFPELAPYLSVLIHDEAPLDPVARRCLRPECRTLHRSWVANLTPYAAPFHSAAEDRILFLGSELGYTPHRRRQVEFLRARFRDRMVAIHDHSVPVADRLALGRFKVGFCPEGRMFTTPGMSATHTDRPFWSGCLGMVPVAENSRSGGRLEALHEARLIRRYRHGDLADLERAVEAALATPTEERRRIYDHFNRHETIGSVVASAMGEATGCTPAAGAPNSAPCRPQNSSN